MKKTTKILFLIFIYFVSLCLFEFLIGFVANIAEIRKNSDDFYSQVKSLQLYTQIYIPNHKTSYIPEHRPEGERFFSRFSKLKFYNDDKGYITVSFPYDRKGKDKIIFVGGSTTECNEVDEEFRFPFLVGEILEKDYKKYFDTLNYGVRGHTTQDSINLLMYIHRYMHPRYIVMMHNINDRSWLRSNYSYSNVPYSASWENSSIKFINFLKFKTNIGFVVINWLEKMHFIQNRFPGDHRPLSKTPTPHPVFITKQDKEVYFVKLFKENLRIFISISRIYGIEPILMTQPLRDYDKEQDCFNQAIRDVSSDQKVHLIDIDKELTKTRGSLFFNDGIHLNNEGSIEVAKIIAARLSLFLDNKE